MLTLEMSKPQEIILSGNGGTATLRPVVGQGSQGPQGPPGDDGAPGGSDAAFAGWIDDPGSETHASAVALIESTAVTFTRTAHIPAFGLYFPEAEGAVTGGVVNDGPAIIAALAAAEAAGGGDVLLDAAIYGNDSVVTVPPTVRLIGTGIPTLNDLTKGSVIKYTGATAQLKIGTAATRGHGSGGFAVNANGTGASTAVFISVNDAALENIIVSGAPGEGFRYDHCQNSTFKTMIADQCQDNWVIDNGTGGCKWSTCHSTTFTRYGLWAHDSNPGGGSGYQFGPADLLFENCIVEHYGATCDTPVRIDSAPSRVHFHKCGFAMGSATASSGYVIKITNDDFPTTTATLVEFTSCNYHGGGVGQQTPIFYIKGTNTVTNNGVIVNGHSFFQQTDSVFTTDGPTVGILDDEATYYAGTVTAKFTAIGAGGFALWRKVQRTGTIWETPNATGAWNGHLPIVVRQIGDNATGSRFFISNTGVLGWCNGTNNVALVSATPDTTNKFVTFSGLKQAGKSLREHTDAVPAAGSNVVTDASAGGPVYTYTLISTGSIASWTISNPTDGQEITIAVYRVGAQTMVWPSSNVRYEGNAAPATPTTGTMTFVTLRYIASLSMWMELSRSVNVPAT